MAIQFVASNGATAANFILVIILSRILSPTEIGIFSMAAVVVGFAHVFRDFGVVAFIKRQKELTPEVLRAAMGVLMVASWSIAAILFLVSGMVADYFAQAGVRSVLRVLAVGFLFIPFGSIPQAVLARELQAAKLAYVTLIATTVYFGTTIVLALAGFSYMTMAWANLINIIVSSLAYSLVRPRGMPWLPSFIGWRQVTNFGLGAMLTSSLKAIDEALGDLMLGKLANPHFVGIYSRGNSTVNIVSHIAGPTIEFTALPYLAKAYHGGADLAFEMQRAVSYLTGLFWPALLAIALFAHEIVAVLYGPTWLEASAVIPWLCLAAASKITFTLMRPALTGIGHPYWVAVPLGSVVALKIGIALAIFDGSLVSFARAVAIAELLAAPAYLMVAYRFLRMPLAAWARALRQSAMIGLATGLAMAGLLPVIAPLTAPVPRLLAAAATSFAVWLVAVYATRHPLRDELARALLWLKQR